MAVASSRPPSSGGAAPATSSTHVAAPAVSIVSGGDTIGDRGVGAYIAAHGADAVFADIAPTLRAADAAWVNLESPLTDLSAPYPGKDVNFGAICASPPASPTPASTW